MSRIRDAKRMWDGWKSRFDELHDTDEKVVMALISLAVVALVLFFILTIAWVVLSFVSNFWPVLLGVALGWYFWPNIKDFMKKGRR